MDDFKRQQQNLKMNACVNWEAIGQLASCGQIFPQKIYYGLWHTRNGENLSFKYHALQQAFPYNCF